MLYFYIKRHILEEILDKILHRFGVMHDQTIALFLFSIAVLRFPHGVITYLDIGLLTFSFVKFGQTLLCYQ
jgi:hypothetical protein